MWKVKYLEHPADILIEIESDSLEELLKGFSSELYSIFLGYKFNFNDSTIFHNSIDINIEGNDWVSLFINWLNELIYYIDAKRIIFSNFIFTKILPHKIESKGFYSDDQFILRGMEVKQVTFHNSLIEQNQNKYRGILLFDI